MDLDMFKHKSTQLSISKLISYGNLLIPPVFGELASGLVGEGRMAEPQDIIGFIERNLSVKLPLHGKTFLITAGPTFESIDPVRFIGNHSSGKMGFEMAKTAASLGAKVYLITGPSNQIVSNNLIKRIDVVSAEEMYNEVHKLYSSVNIAILSAAVADYKPKNVSSQKIKKVSDSMSIELVKTHDILASLGKIKKQQFLVGFALETNDGVGYAKDKLVKKNADAIVLNTLSSTTGFESNTNAVEVFYQDGEQQSFPLLDKSKLGQQLLSAVLNKFQWV